MALTAKQEDYKEMAARVFPYDPSFNSPGFEGIRSKAGHLSEEVKNKMRIAAMKRPELFGAWSVI